MAKLNHSTNKNSLEEAFWRFKESALKAMENGELDYDTEDSKVKKRKKTDGATKNTSHKMSWE